MNGINDYLNQLQLDKQTLVDTLNAKGVEASNEETFTSLVPKVNSIETGGGDEELEASFISSIDDSLGANVTKLPDGLTGIGNYAFYDCSNLALTKLPSSLTNIGQYAFYDCSNLALTELPDGLTGIGQRAFYNCTNLALTKLPDNLTNVGQYAFYNCPSLALTELPSGITAIWNYTFYNCTNLALTKLPSEITNIGQCAFYNCTNLALIELPSSLTSIGESAFYNCTNLTKITFPNATRVPTLKNSNAFKYTPIANGTGYIYVPDDLVDSFKSASNWSTYAEQIRPISSLNNILDLDQQHFPITTDGNLTVDYDATSQTFTLNGTVEESHGFNIPITQELLGTYTLSYNHTETDKAFYISIDNNTETMLNGWGTNTKTFTLTEQPSQLMFWFDYSDSAPERNVYTDYKINLVLEKGENE